MSGRNRTATALLVGSASASSEPLQESINDGKGSTLHKNSNGTRKEHYQLLNHNGDAGSGTAAESTNKHLLISQNVIESRKKRLKTSHGTKSGTSGMQSTVGGAGYPSKLPLMHTVDH